MGTVKGEGFGRDVRAPRQAAKPKQVLRDLYPPLFVRSW